MVGRRLSPSQNYSECRFPVRSHLCYLARFALAGTGYNSCARPYYNDNVLVGNL